jgi:hypothetical protein
MDSIFASRLVQELADFGVVSMSARACRRAVRAAVAAPGHHACDRRPEICEYLWLLAFGGVLAHRFVGGRSAA